MQIGCADLRLLHRQRQGEALFKSKRWFDEGGRRVRTYSCEAERDVEDVRDQENPDAR